MNIEHAGEEESSAPNGMGWPESGYGDGGHVVHSPTYLSREQSPIELDGMDWLDNGGFVKSLTSLSRDQSPFDFQLAQEPHNMSHMQDNTNQGPVAPEGVAGPSSRESGSPSRGEGGSSLSIAKARADGKAPAAAASAGGTSTSYLCR